MKLKDIYDFGDYISDECHGRHVRIGSSCPCLCISELFNKTSFILLSESSASINLNLIFYIGKKISTFKKKNKTLQKITETRKNLEKMWRVP